VPWGFFLVNCLHWGSPVKPTTAMQESHFSSEERNVLTRAAPWEGETL